MRAFCSQLQLSQCTTHMQIPLQELGSLLPESKLHCRKRCGCKKKSLFPSPTLLNIFLRNLGRNQPSTTLCTTASWAQSHQLPACLGSPQRAEGPVLAAPGLVSAVTKGLHRGWKPTPLQCLRGSLQGPAQDCKATGSFPPWALVGSAKSLCTPKKQVTPTTHSNSCGQCCRY